jgi:hypothetical protein
MSESDYKINWSDVVVPNKLLSVGTIKPNYNMMFHNADGEQVGTLDFNGSGLAFEGNAELSAIVFIDWLAKMFDQRLKDEFDKGFAAGKDFTNKTTTG